MRSRLDQPSHPQIRVLILGSYVFAEEIADLIDETPGLVIAGFVENLDRKRCETQLLGLPVYWVDDIAALATDHHLLCGIGTTKRRAYVEQVARHGLPFARLVHPSARMSKKSTLGYGSILSANVVVAAQTQIGNHVIINRGALVGHHTVVGDFVTVSPGANIAGACVIEDGCYIAMGAIVLWPASQM